MQATGRPGLFRQTPPGVFPPILGLFGLGLAWRQAAGVFEVPGLIAEAILGAVTLLFLFALFAYLAKVLRKPAAFAQDLRIMPGRAGLSAGTGAAMLLAATLVPYSTSAASLVLLAAIAAHALVAFVVVLVLWSAPLEQRRITPVWHLTFVGFIIAPVAAAPLGAGLISELIFVVTLPLAITIWAGHAWLVRRQSVPAPLRPMLAIHLSPICLFGIVTGLLGLIGLAAAFGWLAITVMAVFLVRLRYLLAAGFSPMWGSFTFPLAAFANLMLLLAIAGEPFRILGGIGLIAATLAVPYISYRILKLWAAGKLGPMTNAARI
ncbi:MAG: tellurium resistance protein [Paracoccaceae bacterium]